MKLCCFLFLWERETLPNKRRFSKTALASSFTFDNLESAPQLRPQKVPWPIRFGNLLKRKVKVPTKRLIQRYLLMHRLYRLRFGKPFIINYDGTVGLRYWSFSNNSRYLLMHRLCRLRFGFWYKLWRNCSKQFKGPFDASIVGQTLVCWKWTSRPPLNGPVPLWTN